MNFSQRHGFEPQSKPIQLKGMDRDLMNSLWNCFSINFFEKLPDYKFDHFAENIWIDFFKLPIDDLAYYDGKVHQYTFKEYLRKWFFSEIWYRVYDFIEFILQIKDPIFNGLFIECCNIILEREFAGYRIINDVIAPITSDIEIKSIEDTFEILQYSYLKPVDIHLSTALEMLSRRENPDYRNSVKESISSIGALSLIINGKNEEFANLMNILKTKLNLHGALTEGFKKIYGYTSDSDGIRHPLTDEPDVNFEDAKYFLVACSAFINYLIMKCDRIGIKIKQ